MSIIQEKKKDLRNYIQNSSPSKMFKELFKDLSLYIVFIGAIFIGGRWSVHFQSLKMNFKHLDIIFDN